MSRFLALLVVLAIAAAACQASNFESLGYSEGTTIVGPGTDACSDGTLIYHHDDSFENAFGWNFEAVVPPYYGAFGEGYDLGQGMIYCGAYWLTTLDDFYTGQTSDCYIWEGGTDAPPDAVLGVVTGVVFNDVAIWPAIGQYDIDLNIAVTGPFTVGYWGNWPGAWQGFWCAADLNGRQGHPWTCIAPGQDYPSGWQDPGVVWGMMRSLGCGVYFEQGTPAEGETWGAVKALFRQ
jgi:hypothetical protein